MSNNVTRNTTVTSTDVKQEVSPNGKFVVPHVNEYIDENSPNKGDNQFGGSAYDQQQQQDYGGEGKRENGATYYSEESEEEESEEEKKGQEETMLQAQ
jgi:hypothetical protein